MLKDKIKSALVILGLMLVMPISAHVTPEHVLGLTHDTSGSWSLLEIALLISTLVIAIGLLSRKQKIDKG